MTKRPHWSYSQLSLYLRCPLQFYFQYVIGLPRRTVSSNLVLGSAVHEALAAYHRSIQSGQPIAGAEIQTVFLKNWNERCTREAIVYDDARGQDDCLAQGVALIETYLKEAPQTGIVAVEHELITPIRNSSGEYLEKPLVAVADLILRDQAGLRIRDYKTSGRCYSSFEAETSLQATCYVNATQELFGELATFEYTLLVKTKTPKVQYLATARNDADIGRLGDLVQVVDRAVEAGVFYPHESPLNCSSCPYRAPCRDWGRPAAKREPESIPAQKEAQPC